MAIVVLAVAGVAAGYVNTIAGAGSMLTLPALLFTGLDAGSANATNRIAVLFQGIAAAIAFHRSGVRVGRVTALVALPASIGAVLGSLLASALDDGQLRRLRPLGAEQTSQQGGAHRPAAEDRELGGHRHQATS